MRGAAEMIGMVFVIVSFTELRAEMCVFEMDSGVAREGLRGPSAQ